jgi:hypothetical protein
MEDSLVIAMGVIAMGSQRRRIIAKAPQQPLATSLT